MTEPTEEQRALAKAVADELEARGCARCPVSDDQLKVLNDLTEAALEEKANKNTFILMMQFFKSAQDISRRFVRSVVWVVAIAVVLALVATFSGNWNLIAKLFTK